MRRRGVMAVVMALAGGAVAAALLAGHHLTRPEPHSAGTPPTELGAAPVSFAAPTGRVRGWWSRGVPGRGTVLLLHALHGDRSGMAGRAVFLRALGFSVLAIDLPAHGESDGERISFGFRESSAVLAAARYARDRSPGEAVGALGVSLGGASLLLGAGPPRLQAVVLESVYPEIGAAIRNRLALHLGRLGPGLAPLLEAQLHLWTGGGPETLRPIGRIGRLQAPLLLVHGAADRHTTEAEARALFAAAAPPKDLWIVPGAAHEDLHAAARPDYERRVGEFFGKHLSAR